MSQVLTVCIFCGHEVSEDAISCAGCKEYKGITKATECVSCGDLVPLGQRCNCQPPPPKIISPGNCLPDPSP